MGEEAGYSDAISWVDNGTAFQIHDREKFIPVLKERFHVIKWKSFLRQIQGYKFQRETPNVIPIYRPSRMGKWRHPLFRRDQPSWCTKMKRRTEDSSKANRNAMQSRSQQPVTTGVRVKPVTAVVNQLASPPLPRLTR